MTTSTAPVVIPQLHLFPSFVRSIAQQQGALIHTSQLLKLGCAPPFESWIQVAGRVFKTIPSTQYPVHLVGLPYEEYLQLPPQLAAQGVNVSLFKQGRAPLHPLTTLTISVTYTSTRRYVPTPFQMMEDSISNAIRCVIYNQFFFDGQRITFPIVGGILGLTIHLPHLGEANQPFSIQPRAYGFVDRNTSITLQSHSPQNLKILKGFARARDALLSFQVHPTKLKEDESFLVIHNDELKSSLLSSFDRKSLHEKQGIVLNLPEIGSVTLTLYSMRSATRANLSDYCVLIEQEQVISFFSEEPTLKIVHGAPRIPESVSVTISQALSVEEAGSNEHPSWLVADELTSSLKRLKPGIILGQKVTLRSQNVFYRAAVTSMTFEGVEPKRDQHWKIGRKTHIAYTINFGNIPLVDSSSLIPLRSVTYEISVPEWAAPLELSYERVLRIIDRKTGDVIASNQRIPFTMRGVPHPLIARVVGLKSIDHAVYRFGFLGKIRKATEKTLECGSNQLNLIRVSPQEALADPGFELRKLGIAALSPECISYLKELLMMNATIRSELNSRGVMPPLGTVLHGPSGTGKSSLAKAIRQLLGIPNSRYHLANGPALVGSTTSETDINIKKLFQKIPKDSEPYLHIVVIDNIEALGSAGNINLDTLLSALRQLKEQSNVFVICICQDLQLIAPQLIHPHFLYPQVEFKKPNLMQREEIFNIHLSRHYERGNVPDDVCVHRLAEVTQEFTHAEIASVVRSAFIHSLPEAFATHDGGSSAEVVGATQVTMGALLHSIAIHKEARRRCGRLLPMYS